MCAVVANDNMLSFLNIHSLVLLYQFTSNQETKLPLVTMAVAFLQWTWV